MTIRKKSKEELKNQVEGFLEYEKGKRKIDDEKSKELFDILLNNESISASKEQTKEQLVGVLSSEEFDGLYEDYRKWLEKSNKVRKNIIEKILPKEYLFLSNENYLKNYFIDSKLDDKQIERLKNRVEKNIGILKKYNIEDKDLKLFIEFIPDYSSEIIENNLKLFYDNGITDIDDLCLLKDGMKVHSDWKEENIKSLNMLGITEPKKLIKLKKIVLSKNPESTRINLETLKNVGVTNIDDLKNLQDIIIAGKYRFKGLLFRGSMENTPETISESLKLLTKNGITSPSDLLSLEKIIKEGKAENLGILVKNGITSPDDLLLLEKIIKEGKTENLQVLIDHKITSPGDLLSLEEIIKKGNEKNLEILMSHEITSPDDLLLLEKIIKEGKSENLQILVENGITSSSDLLSLEEVIRRGKTEILNLLIKNNIKNAKDLGEGYREREIWKPEIFTLLVEQGIDTLDELDKLSYTITFGNVDNLKIFIEYGINFKDSLKDLKEVIERWKPESIRILKDKLKFSVSDILNLYKNGFYWGITTENLEILIGKGAQTVNDLLEFENYLKQWNKKGDNIKYLEKIGIITFEELKDIKNLVNFGRTENFEIIFKNVDDLKLLIEGIKSKSNLKDIENIIIYGNNDIIIELFNLGLDSVNDLIDLIDIIKSNANPLEIKKQIEILFEDNFELKEIKNFQQAIIYGNISIFEGYFGKINKDGVGNIEMKVLSGIELPKDLEFKERNHKGYLKFIAEIIDTTYEKDKKTKMIKKIVTLGFNEAEKYLEVFKMLDTSISMDVQRVKNELIDEILESDKPLEVAEKIKDIFEKNNVPLTGKIFKVFELLYPKEKFNSKLQPASGKRTLGSPVLNNYKDEGKNVYRLIYKDLMNIAIKSGDRSLKEYLNTFIGSEEVLKKFEGIVGTPGFNPDDEQCLKGISDDEKEQLRYLFKKIATLSNMFLGKEVKEGNKGGISHKDLLDFYNEIKKGFNLRDGKSIYERLQTLLYVNGLGYHSAREVLEDMDKHKKQAHERGLKLYNEAIGEKIDFPKHAFLKGVTEDAFSKIINRGITSREYLGGGDDGNAAGSDLTPFDIDGWYTDAFLEGGYGGVKFIVDTEKNSIVDTGEKGITGYDENQYELFKTGGLGEKHYGIRTGIPTTEIDYIIYTGNFESKDFETICYEIARNGYYIPIADKDGNIKFTPEMYHRIRAGFNYMEYYDGFGVEKIDGKYVSKVSDNEIHRDTDDTDMVKLVQENSPKNEKYRDFAKENRELAESTIEWIKKILEEKCGIMFNSKYDSSITGAELHDSGSTGRGTDIPTKDVDLDFTLILDAKDYERVAEISKVIHEEIGTQKDDDHGVIEGGNQIKSKVNNIGKSEERPNGVPLDLLILKKSQVIDYSSSDAMKEKLDYIKDNLGEEALNFVRTSVIIMKKLLKAKGCYKKPEGGISGIGVENRIIQNHGNFIEALESFEQVAYGGKYKEGITPKPLSEFQKLYPMYDAGENYKDGCNDNFVYKLEGNGYQGTLEIIKAYRLKGMDGIREIIKEYETKKSEFIE